MLKDLEKDFKIEIFEKNLSFRYYNYEEMIWFLKEYFRKYSKIVCLYDIGILV